MNFRLPIVRTIARKELVESLRDRRTLFMMIFMPVLLYPALMLVVTQVASVQQQKLEDSRSVVAVHGPGLLSSADAATHPLVLHLEASDALEVEVHTDLKSDVTSELSSRIASDGEESIDVVVNVLDWPVGSETNQGTGHVEIHFKSIEDSSRKAVERVELALTDYTELEVTRRLELLELPPTVSRPVASVKTDHSDESQRGGFLLASIAPMLVVITVLLGAFYPAIDLTAGEKERGSIQTLFTAPLTVIEILGGKYLAVVCIALISGLANLASMALMFGYLGNTAFAGSGIEIALGLPALGVLLLIIVLVALFFAAVVLAVAVLARDFKDAQNLMTPLMLAAVLPGVVAQMPGFELTRSLAMVPAVNVILLMKETLIHGVDLEALFLVSASSLVATILALVFAAKLFGQERIIVGERGSFDLLVKPSDIVPKPRPSVGEGLAWFCVSFVLLFYVGSWAQARDLKTGLLITLWLVLLVPTVSFSRYLKLDLRETFALRRPSANSLAAASILGVSSWVVVSALNRIVELVLPTPDAFIQGMSETFSTPDNPASWAYFLAVFALTPGICEEMLFRGYLFSSLRDRVKPWTVILVTGVLFGLFHLSIYRLFGTTMLGIIMGILVYQSGSIFPSMLFHFLNNASVLLISARYLPDADDRPPAWAVAVAAALLVLGLWLLNKEDPDGDAVSARSAETG